MVVMTEIYESAFHKRYVDGSGIVIDKGEPYRPKNEIKGQTYEEILVEYRAYVHDPKAELPVEILEELRKQGKIQ